MESKRIIQYGISALVVVVTLICLFTPSILFLKQASTYTLFIMLGMLASGFLCFMFEQQRLMMVNLLCCGALCLYLKGSANKEIRLPDATANPSIRVSHISLGNAESEYDSVINYLLDVDADFLSFQELTPDWNIHLTNRLTPAYQYVHTMTRLDQYGMGFFSKLPFQKLDTIYYRDIPALVADVPFGERDTCHIISCQVMPPVNQAAFLSIAEHFDIVSKYVRAINNITMVMGDFHLPPWTVEVLKFKTTSQLNDGRRDIHPRNLDGSMSLPRIPVEHILYTDQLECTSFAELGNSLVGRIGITGSYQLQAEPHEMAE